MTQGTENRNNGHKTYTPDGFNPGTVLRPQQNGGDDKIILTIGKEERELLMKADFINEDHVKKAILAIKEARDFHNKTLEAMIWDSIAGYTAIGGKRTDRFVTLRTGVWLQDNKLQRAQEKDRREQGVRRE
jgi:hypothetical protein